MKHLFAWAFFCLSFLSGYGQSVLLTEHFNYPADSLLQSNGWFGHSAASTNPIRVTNGGLSWTTTPYIGSGVGNAAAVKNTGADENRPFSTFVNSGSVYSSFLLRVDSTPAPGDSSYFFHIGQYGNTTNPVFTTISTAFRGRTFVLPGTTANNFRLGLTFNSNNPGSSVTSQTYNVGQTYLVVLKYTFVAGTLNDSVSLFVFADGANITQEPSSPTLGPFAGTATDLDFAQLVALRQYSATQRITVDGIVVRTNWNFTPPPPQSSLPITWDAAGIGYTFTDFGGNNSALAPSPTDTTNRTLRTEKTVGAQTWAGTTITPITGLSTPIPFASGATNISVKVHAPAAGIVVRLKAEQAGTPTISVETEATTTAAGWQTLVFNFANQATGTAPINFANTYNLLSIFYGFGSAGTGAIFYADSVFFGGSGPVGPPPALVNLPITWDNLTLNYSFTDFGGNSSSLAPSPTDTTNRTLRTEKTVGAQTWAGTTITPATGLAMPIPFANGATTIRVKVHTPAAGVIVRLKAEQAGTPTISVETEDTTTAAGWQTLEFNFANQVTGTAAINFANTYNMLSIFYGFGSAGTGTVFFADSVFFGGGPVGPPPALVNLPITWDDLTLNYSFTDFGGNSSSLAPSPTDTTNRTLRTEKTVGAQTWAGTTITPTTGLAMPIPFALGSSSISVKVHAPAAGVVVRLKAEQAGTPTISVETEDTTTAAGWQTLVFNFANPAAGTAPLNLTNTYNVLSIFYGFGNAGTGAVFFADSVYFGGGPILPPPPAINLPITWDNMALQYPFTDFGGNNSSLAPSPTDTTNRTLRTEKTAGAQTWAGTTITPVTGLTAPIPFTIGASSISVKVHAPASGIVVRLKAEQAGVPTVSVETEATTTTAGWQTLVFNFANPAAGTAQLNLANTYNVLSIFYGFGTAGTGAVFYADSVFFGGGPVGPPPTPINLPITWDNLALNYTFTDFGGNNSALAPSPTDTTNRTLRSEKTVGAQTWAGTTLTPPLGLATAIPFATGATSMTVKVHAPAAGIVVRLKAEQAGVPTISVETEATTTVAGWQNLVFNFANQATGTAPINFANTYNLLSIFYGFGSAGTGAVFFADSVFFGGNPVTPPQLVNVTFQVDMSRETISPNGIHMAGAFQGWNPSATPMVSQGNGIYTYTAQLPANTTQEYKFINGNQWGPGFDESVPSACAQGGNRFIAVGTSNITVPLVCFGRCTACGVSVFEPGSLNASIKVYPNPASSQATVAYQFDTPGDLQISVYNVRGQLVTTRMEKGQTDGEVILNVQDWAEGLYHIRISNGYEQIARQLVVSK